MTNDVRGSTSGAVREVQNGKGDDGHSGKHAEGVARRGDAVAKAFLLFAIGRNRVSHVEFLIWLFYKNKINKNHIFFKK